MVVAEVSNYCPKEIMVQVGGLVLRMKVFRKPESLTASKLLKGQGYARGAKSSF